MLPARKRGAAVLAHAALLLLLFAATAPWLRSRGKQVAQARAEHSFGCGLATSASRGKVYLRYDSYAGLCNQLNCHVTGLALAQALGVDAVVLPPAWSRTADSFNRSRLDQTWFKDNPVSTLLDVEGMAANWSQRGIQLLQATTELQEPEWHGCIRTRSILEVVRAATFKRQYLKAPLVHFVAHVRSEINAVWAQHGPNTCIVLESDKLFVALDLTSTANLATATAASLQFSPQIEAIADRVVNLIGPEFNGVHLRIERDMGLDAKVIIPQYLALMRELGFNSTTPLYVASALLTYDDATEFDRMAALLHKEGLCSHALAKERLLPAADLAGLHSEQLALVDLLVLTRTARFVGHQRSTFSITANDLRVIREGADLASGQLVDQYIDPGLSLLPV